MKNVLSLLGASRNHFLFLIKQYRSNLSWSHREHANLFQNTQQFERLSKFNNYRQYNDLINEPVTINFKSKIVPTWTDSLSRHA